jgi:hypothetical protein
MKKLTGNHLTEFPFQNLFKVGDLVNYKGPLLSLFSNEKGELFLFHWCDSDVNYNRWLVFKITLIQLFQYLNRKISHYQLITTYFTDYIISVDISNKLDYHNILLLNLFEMPEEYLPEKDVLHDDEESPHVGKIRDFINQLEVRVVDDRRKRWQQKFKTGLPFEQVVVNSRRISNREQILAVG